MMMGLGIVCIEGARFIYIYIWGKFDKSSIERVWERYITFFWLGNKTHYIGECDI